MEVKKGTGTPVEPPNPFRMGENHPKDQRLRKNIEKLVQVCTDRLNRDSNHSRALYIRASCLMRLGELDKALEDCSSYLRILSKEGFNDVSAIDGLYLRGCIFQRKGQIKQAIVDFSTVLESESNHFNARLGRASCYNYLGEFDLAIEDYEGGLQGDSTREKLNMSKRLRDSRSYEDERGKSNMVPLAPQQVGIMSILAPVEGEQADEGILPVIDLRSKKQGTKQPISNSSISAQKREAGSSHPSQKTPNKASVNKQPKDGVNAPDGAGRSPNGRSNSKGASYAGLPFSGSKQKPSTTAGDLELSTHSEAEKWYKLGSQLRKSLRYPEAISHYTKAIELSPNHTRAIFNRGFVYDKLGRFKEAIADYTECIKLEPLNSFAWYNKGISLNNIMDFEGACQCFSKAIQIDGSNADFYHNRGYALRKLQEYRRALSDFDLALQLNPSHFRALFNRVYCYERLGDFEQALRDIKRCRDLEPQNHDVVLSLATLLTRKADRDSLEQAESYLLQLLSEKANEQDPVLINSLATIYEKQKRYELALKYFTQACQLAAPHRNPVYENNRACALRDVGRVQESLEVFADLVESDPSNPRYYSNIGLLYRRVGELDKAIEIYTKEISCTKTPHPSAWTKRAYCYAKAGYIEQAIEDYSRAIGIEAANTHSLFNRGLCLQKVGRLAEAVKDFSVVLQLEPNHITAYYSRAGCLDAMGRVDEAVADYSKAMSLEEEIQRASHGANPQHPVTQSEPEPRKTAVNTKPS